jgi:hypothetical protein
MSLKQKVRSFLQRATVLAGYVGELPSIVHSSDATEATKPVVPYEDSEFAMIMLHAMPHNKWQTQYNLGHKAPANSGYLQDAMKKIEIWNLQEQSHFQQNDQNDRQDSQEEISSCEA